MTATLERPSILPREANAALERMLESLRLVEPAVAASEPPPGPAAVEGAGNPVGAAPPAEPPPTAGRSGPQREPAPDATEGDPIEALIVPPPRGDEAPGPTSAGQVVIDWESDDESNARFNVLDPSIVPDPGDARRRYADEVARVVVDEVRGDPATLAKAARTIAALAEMAVAASERDRAEPASMPLLADWIDVNLVSCAYEEVGPDAVADATARAILKIIPGLVGMEPGAARRTRSALLALKADRSSADVVATMVAAMEVFRDERVRANTGASDFGPGNFELHRNRIRPFRVQVAKGTRTADMLTRLMHAALKLAMEATDQPSYRVVTTTESANGGLRIAPLG